MGAFSDDPTPGRATLSIDLGVTNNMLGQLPGGGIQCRIEHVDSWPYRRAPEPLTMVHKGLHGWYDGPHVEGDAAGVHLGGHLVLTLTPGVKEQS